MRAIVLRGVTWRAMGLIVCETAVIVGAVGLAAYIRLGRLELSWAGDLLPKALLIALVAQLCLYFADLYDFRVITDRRELFIRAVQALGATSLILAGTYYWLPDLIVGRGVFILAAAFVIALVFGWRIAFEWAARRMGPRERLLLVGTSESAVRLAKELYDRRDLGVEIVGFIDPDPGRVGEPVINPGIIGTVWLPSMRNTRARFR
jgi:FlaA1/EpsC-like NDP-sugar epimerase